MKIGIIGCSGRMGRTLLHEVIKSEKCELSGGIDKNDSPFKDSDLGILAGLEAIGLKPSSNLEELIQKSDAIIDFTTPQSSIRCAELTAKHKKIHVIGTTGFSNDEFAKLKKLSSQTPIFWSSNMSVGVNLLFSLVEKVSGILDDDFDIEIVEMHHNRKVDSPSGTALSLGEAAAKGRNVSLDEVARKSRDGIIGARPKGEIGFATIRGGDVVGDHTVIFAAEGERLELTHKASSRSIFARGAIRAALWCDGKDAGFYNMRDALF